MLKCIDLIIVFYLIMMYKRIVVGFTLWLGISFGAFSQEMSKGFTYLEQGEFSLAEEFFKDVLKEYPTNKTAKLCFARATGLNGDAQYALVLMQELRSDYPNDFEVSLNCAEALLWNKFYLKAEVYYKNLLEEDSESFPAILGYANTLSSLKKYKEALMFVNKAIEIQPENNNVLISKKYIHLGYSNQLVKSKKYKEGVDLLRKNLELFPGDKETIMNLGNTFIISENYIKAQEIYAQLINTPEEIIESKLGLSLVYHLRGDNKKALDEIELAFKVLPKLSDSTLDWRVKERYVQALIWNKAFLQAESYMLSLNSNVQNENWFLGLQAMLNVYKRDFNKSVLFYKKMLERDSVSFDGNLGLANAYKALNRFDNAYEQGLISLSLYNGQKDILNFLRKLDEQFYPTLLTDIKYSFDNGDNESYSISNTVNYPLTSKLAINSGYQYRETWKDNTKYDASVHQLISGVEYRIIPTLLLNADIGLNRISAEENDYNQWLTKLSLHTSYFKLQEFKLGYIRELENFNAELLYRKIVKDMVFINHNLNTNIGLGWFNQYFYTSQNDNNTRHLYFTSLYYQLSKQPSSKVGANFQYITFGNQVPTIYFSPERFKVIEVFGEVVRNINILKGRGVYYSINGALGYQFIEDQKKQSTYRIKLDLGYKASSRFSSALYYQKSNIASGNTAGFSYSEFGLRLKWMMSDKSVFTKIKTKINYPH